MKRCATCSFRWTRQALWYCRKSTIERAVLIGNEAEMKAAKGCWEWMG